MINQILGILPRSENKAKLITNWQSESDLIKAIMQSHAENLKYAKKINRFFDDGTPRGTAYNVFQFLKNYVPYKVEPASKQAVKTLPRMLNDAKLGIGSDCKMYSVFTNTILNSLGYHSIYRFTGYKGDNLTHVYSYMPKQNLVIDAVLPNFDTEKPYTNKKDMSLYQMSGIDDDIQISGINFKKLATNVKTNIKQAVQNIPANAKKVVQGAKTVSMAVPRNAFLLLVKVNAKGLATKLKKLKDKNNDFKWWFDIGGDRTILKKTIDDGAKKKAILGGVIEENQSRQHLDYSSLDATIGEPMTVATALATATPILIKVYQEFKKSGVDVPEAINTVQKASAGFENLTGKKVTDVIFKKDAGVTTNETKISPASLKPTTMQTATKIVDAVTKVQTGLNTQQLNEAKSQLTLTPTREFNQGPLSVSDVLPKSNQTLKQPIDFKKYTPFIVGGLVLTYFLFNSKKNRR
jgi:putative IMPACT (imprinted ancient) family translation regulator